MGGFYFYDTRYYYIETLNIRMRQCLRSRRRRRIYYIYIVRFNIYVPRERRRL